MDKQQLIAKLETAWAAFEASYAGLPDTHMTEPCVVGDWSVKDILAHVTTWEQEALKYLPVILAGVRPPRYSTQYGGLDAFNALISEQKRVLSLAEVLGQMSDTHRRLLDYVRGAPDEPFRQPTPFRHRLRLESYAHYNLHAKMIRDWRARSGL
jgi:hypothetical protein